MGSGAAALSDVRHTEPEALGNLTAVLQLCAAGKLRCSEKTRRPSAATVRTVAEALVAGDFYPDEAIASFAWPLLLQAGGLARLDGPRLTLTPKGRKALGQPAPRGDPWALGTLAAARPDRRVQPRGPDQGPEVRRGAERRRAAPPGRGGRARPLPAGRVDRRRRACSPRCAAPALSPTIARSERGLWKLYLGDPEYGSLGYAGFHDWPILEGRYTLAVLFEYAATLGLLDVDYVSPAHARDDFRQMWGADWIDALSRYDGLRAVRLTALGAYAAGLTTTYTPAAPPLPWTAPCRCWPTSTSSPPPTSRRPTGSSSTPSPPAPPTGCGPCRRRASWRPSMQAGRPASSPPSWTSAPCTRFPRRSAGCSPTSRPAPGRSATSGPAASSNAPTRVSPPCSPEDRSLRGLCIRLGERHLMLDPASEPKARAALRKLGYPLGPTTR